MALVTAISSATSHRAAPSAASLASASAGTARTGGAAHRAPHHSVRPAIASPRGHQRLDRGAGTGTRPSGGHAGGRSTAHGARAGLRSLGSAAAGVRNKGGGTPLGATVFATSGVKTPVVAAAVPAGPSSQAWVPGAPAPSATGAAGAGDGGVSGAGSLQAATSTAAPTSGGSGSGGSGSGGSGSGGSGSGVTPTTGAYPGQGTIESPATSASFAAAGGGTVSANATWTGAVELELAISCPGGVSVSRAGASPLSLELDDRHGSGTCTVTLALLTGTRAKVAFNLVVQPAP